MEEKIYFDDTSNIWWLQWWVWYFQSTYYWGEN
jgi:hypothetical protein